jgi:hypothetical protein
MFASALPHGSHGRESHRAGTRSTREEDSRSVLESDSKTSITPPRPSSSQMPSRILGGTSKRSTRLPRDFPSKIGEGEAHSALPRRHCIHSPCSLMAAPALHRLWAARQGHASILSDQLDHWTPPPVFSREKSVMPRQLPQSPGSFRNERG